MCGSSNKTQTLDFIVLIFYYLGLVIYEHLYSRHSETQLLSTTRIHFWLQLHTLKRSRCQTLTTSPAVGFISYLKPPWGVKFGVLSAEEPLGLKLVFPSIPMVKFCNDMFAFRRSAGLSQRYECKYGCWLNPMSSRSFKSSVLLNFVNLP